MIAQSMPDPSAPPGVVPQYRGDAGRVRIIPYDHVATFDLRGSPGDVHQDVINAGVEGIFVAVAVGYGVSEERGETVPIRADEGPDQPLSEVRLDQLPVDTLVDGVRLRPSLSSVWSGGTGSSVALDDITVERANGLGVLETLRRPRTVDFTFSLVDTSTGRELQNAPVHNRAGLGRQDGERPFRLLARPFAFLPRSSLRVDVRESSRVGGRLSLVLHGFKILGAAGLPDEQLRAIYQRAMKQASLERASATTLDRLAAGQAPSSRIIPFDYVGTVELEGEPGRLHEPREIPINVDGSFVATTIGYSVQPPIGVSDDFIDPRGNGGRILLGQLTLDEFSGRALRDGFRIASDRLHLALVGTTLQEVSRELLGGGRLIGPLHTLDRVQFEYGFEDTGTGRAWQNELVHNIAGLGIADGDRPFRRLAWPMTFLPRSTFRITVREVSATGPGTLYLTLQGYKVLG